MTGNQAKKFNLPHTKGLSTLCLVGQIFWKNEHRASPERSAELGNSRVLMGIQTFSPNNCTKSSLRSAQCLYSHPSLAKANALYTVRGINLQEREEERKGLAYSLPRNTLFYYIEYNSGYNICDPLFKQTQENKVVLRRT